MTSISSPSPADPGDANPGDNNPEDGGLVPPRLGMAPPGLPWYRMLAAFRTNALSAWSPQAYEQDFVAASFLGRDRLLINSPEGIRRVLVDNHTNYRRTPATIRIVRPLMGDGIFLSEGDDWRHQRHILAPAFTPRALPLLTRHIAKATQDALVRLDAMARAGRPVDLIATCQYLTLDIAGRSMFSLEMSRHGPTMRRLLARYAVKLARPYLLDFLLPAGIPNLHDLARHRFRTEWVRLIEAIMSDRRKVPIADDAPRDLFDLMQAASDPQTGAGFPAGQLRDQVATMIVAGHETTAVAVFWSLYLLALAPSVQERVAGEADGLDLGPDGAFQALPRLVHARAVVQEALRLYPPAFVIVREAIGQDTICGVPLRPRGLALIAPWVLHRHRKLWRNPDMFDPSRFLPNAEPPDRFAYLPFGVGPRICIGAQFALTEATLIVATLASAFRIEPAGPRSVLPCAVITTQPDHAALFRLNPRHGV